MWEELQQVLWQACRHCSAPEGPAGLRRPHQAGRREAGAGASCVGRWLRLWRSWREGQRGPGGGRGEKEGREAPAMAGMEGLWPARPCAPLVTRCLHHPNPAALPWPCRLCNHRWRTVHVWTTLFNIGAPSTPLSPRERLPPLRPSRRHVILQAFQPLQQHCNSPCHDGCYSPPWVEFKFSLTCRPNECIPTICMDATGAGVQAGRNVG